MIARRLSRLAVSAAFLITIFGPATPAVFADSHANNTNATQTNNGNTNNNGQNDQNQGNPNPGTPQGNQAPGTTNDQNTTNPGTPQGNPNPGNDQNQGNNDNQGQNNANPGAPGQGGEGDAQDQTTPPTDTSGDETTPPQNSQPGDENNDTTETDQKVTLCHATNSDSNPYVPITIDDNGTLDGHDGHTGPIWDPTLKAQHISWGDIIPPFGDFPGMNWTAEGQAILAAGCTVPTPGQGGCTENCGGTGCTENCGETTGCTTNCAGGRGGGEVLGASTVAAVLNGHQGQVLGASTTLPNTGTHDPVNLWTVFAVMTFLSALVYWRELVAPLSLKQ